MGIYWTLIRKASLRFKWKAYLHSDKRPTMSNRCLFNIWQHEVFESSLNKDHLTSKARDGASAWVTGWLNPQVFDDSRGWSYGTAAIFSPIAYDHYTSSMRTMYIRFPFVGHTRESNVKKSQSAYFQKVSFVLNLNRYQTVMPLIYHSPT